MFEQDYIMRLIKEVIRAALKFLFNIDSESSTDEFLEESNFTRKEIQEDLNYVLSYYGLDSIANLFLK